MRIIRQLKNIYLNRDFVVQGSMKELLEFEKILKFNNIESDENWNKYKRLESRFNRILINSKKSKYAYHTHDCGCIPIDVKNFL